jgi:hypothetical protein
MAGPPNVALKRFLAVSQSRPPPRRREKDRPIIIYGVECRLEIYAPVSKAVPAMPGPSLSPKENQSVAFSILRFGMAILLRCFSV